MIFCKDFLENLSDDLPHGVWSIQTDCENKNVNCRNLIWPGYYSMHKMGTSFFGGVYLGNGKKNIDVTFMI